MADLARMSEGEHRKAGASWVVWVVRVAAVVGLVVELVLLVLGVLDSTCPDSRELKSRILNHLLFKTVFV